MIFYQLDSSELILGVLGVGKKDTYLALYKSPNLAQKKIKVLRDW